MKSSQSINKDSKEVIQIILSSKYSYTVLTHTELIMSFVRHDYPSLWLLPRARSSQNFSDSELRGRFPKLIPLLREKSTSSLLNKETYLGAYQLYVSLLQSFRTDINRRVIQKSLLPAKFTLTVSLLFLLRSVKINTIHDTLY